MPSQEPTPRFPWYDSVWLDHYVRAKEFIGKECPDKLDRFMQTFEPLRTRSNFEVQHLRDVISAETLQNVRNAIGALRPQTLEIHEIRNFGRCVVHNDPTITSLQASMTDLVSSVVGEAVEPCYNFLSLYTRLGRCGLHMDAPEAKWTLDMCVDQSEPWPIHIRRVRDWPEEFVVDADWEQHVLGDSGNSFESYTMSPGEALVFSGSSQWHYRNPLPQQNDGHCHLVFLHFIPAGMAEVVRYTEWEDLFEITGLAAALE